MDNKVVFNKDRFNETDQLARDATRTLYKRIEPDWTLIDNPDQFGIDFIVYCKEKLVAYIEAECSTSGFQNGKWKYSQIRLLPRKNHFLEGLDCGKKELKAPIYLCTVSKDSKSAIVYEMRLMNEKSEMVRSYNKVPHRLEPVLEDMYSLDIGYTKSYTIVEEIVVKSVPKPDVVRNKAFTSSLRDPWKY